ncbi:MAG: replication-associated recombination protein A [Clostridiales bacterium]|jgi:putative ATPase|nr:replication-associated recombination protein A [Clostridiales bacterium]
MPLADIVRPATLDEICGQRHLFGKNSPLRRLVESEHIPSLVFYGPPGTGKTTAADIISKLSNKQFFKINATTSSVAELRDALNASDTLSAFNGTLIYIDEIQYFNKKQQQALLEYMEDGRITLICSTTENPYFVLYPAFLSRCACFEFKPLSPEEIVPALKRGFSYLCENYGKKEMEENFSAAVASTCGGDVRKALTVLENTYFACVDKLEIKIASQISQKSTGYDSDGDGHYDLLSALQKSIRGSDPDAAVFYLARILEGGGLLSACRRLMVIASEDIGLAHSNAAVVVSACVDSALKTGMPEASVPLAHATVMLATLPKSNSAYIAYAKAAEDARNGLGKVVPPHISNKTNSPDSKTPYLYPHDYTNHYVPQQYLPEDIKDRKYYTYGDSKAEKAAEEYWKKIKETQDKNTL